MSKCLYCGEERIKPVDEYFCSEECSKKWDIRSDYETCEEDEVICPYCGKAQSDITDGGGYYEASGEAFICDYCGEEFYLTAETYTRFIATPIEEMIDAILNGDAQCRM